MEKNKKPKILIVDDKPENLIALEVVLRDLPVELIKATNGNDALKATLHNDFTLALLDVQMPGMDGYELAGILREEDKTAHLPFIFISAVYTDNLNVFKGYEKGAFSYITKPFQAEILINKVNFFIEKHQQEQELVLLYENLEKKNAELINVNKELASFTYSVSHDLRAPIRALDAYSEMIIEDHSHLLDKEGISLLNKMQYNAKKLGRLVDDLLSFSKLGKKSVGKHSVNMKEVVELILNEINEVTPHKAIINIGEMHVVDGDKNLIHQVWINLIQNAIKYSSKTENPVIEINSFKESDEITYYIKDNGVGFSMEHASKLFNVFQRLHSENDFEGTGVGLAIVQKIILKHGGRVWAESKPGEGATFYFTLPTAP
jgi:two-component system sensor histidine kinase/response regulator